MNKTTHQLKANDVVNAHGGLFRIVYDAKECIANRPLADHLVIAHGASDLAFAKAICIKGEAPGYFMPGSAWTFQGNFTKTWSVVSN